MFIKTQHPFLIHQTSPPTPTPIQLIKTRR